MIDDHAEGLAFDLYHYFHLDLRAIVADLCGDQPVFSPWWLNRLISTLPDDGAFCGSLMAEQLGIPLREARGWGVDRQIAAGTHDYTVAALTFKKTKDRDAAMFPRPVSKKPTGKGWGAFGLPSRPPVPKPKEG